MRSPIAVVLLLLGCALAPVAGAEAPPGLTWKKRLERALEAPGLAGARISALVVDRRSGAVLFAVSPDRAVIPASNLKVLTGVAAFAAFGPSHRFVTEVLAPGALDEEGGLSALIVRGGGDPAMTSEQWWRLAADLRAMGLRRVSGDLLLDDSLFDDERWHSSWAPISNRAFHAPVGALSANYGAFRLHVVPARKAGARARVSVDPPVAYLDLANQVRTASGGNGAGLQVDRQVLGAGERFHVRGSVGAGDEGVDVWRSVAQPARYAGAVLRMQLSANGIAVEGTTRRARVPADAVSLLRFEGLPLGDIGRLFLKNSNNFIAESLLKSMGAAEAEGAPGSWPAGVAAARRHLEALGLDLGGLRMVDGSGLSRGNRTPARLLVEALRAADTSFALGPEFLASLPIGGTDGTLRRRAEEAGGQLRAKTGLLSGVTGLSGFARTAGGREVVFSVLANGYRSGDRPAMGALDDFAAALVQAKD